MSAQGIDFGNLESRLEETQRREEKFEEFRGNVFWFFAGALVAAPFNILLEPIELKNGSIRYGSTILANDVGPFIYIGGALTIVSLLLLLGIAGYKRYIDYDKNPSVKLRLPENSVPVFDQMRSVLIEECNDSQLAFRNGLNEITIIDPNVASGGLLTKGNDVILKAEIDDSIGILTLTYNQRDNRHLELIEPLKANFEAE